MHSNRQFSPFLRRISNRFQDRRLFFYLCRFYSPDRHFLQNHYHLPRCHYFQNYFETGKKEERQKKIAKAKNSKEKHIWRAGFYLPTLPGNDEEGSKIETRQI